MSFVARVPTLDVRLKVIFQIFVGDDVIAAKKVSYGSEFLCNGETGGGRAWCGRQKQQSDMESISQWATLLLMFLMTEALKNLVIAQSIFAYIAESID